MKEVRYTGHLKFRMALREIPENLPREIHRASNERYYDTVEGRNIAISSVFFKGKVRDMMVAFDEHPNHIEIVTIHPIRRERIENRLKSGRWIKSE
jgi:hypothetical protein